MVTSALTRIQNFFADPHDTGPIEQDFRSRFVMAACALSAAGFVANMAFLVADQVITQSLNALGAIFSVLLMYIQFRYERPRLSGALLTLMAYTVVIAYAFNGFFFEVGSLRYIPVVAFCSVYMVSLRFSVLAVAYAFAGFFLIAWAKRTGFVPSIDVTPEVRQMQVIVDTVLAALIAIGAAAIYEKIRRRKDVEILSQHKELHEKQKIIERQNQMSLLGRYTGQLVHNLNNPLTVAMMRLEKLFVVAKRQGPGKEDLLEQIESMRTDLFRIRDVVAGARSFLGHDDGDMRLIDLAQVAGEALVFLQPKLGRNQVHIENHVDSQTILGEKTTVKQVIINLVGNALDVMQNHTNGVIRIYSRAYHNDIRLIVADNGPGVPITDIEKIFEPLFTTKPVGKGSGLGLPLSRDFMRKMGGDLIYAREDGWTRFEMVFPIPSARNQAS